MRRSLFQKYFLTLFLAATVPLVASGISDAWFGYRDQRSMLNTLLRAEAATAAGKIQGFLDGIEQQLGWSVQQSWTPGTEEQRKLDTLRVLRQAAAIVSIALVDEAGIERLQVSRIDLNREATGSDRSNDPAVSGARSAGVWYGPVTYYQESEPFMIMSLAGNRKAAGVAVAEINLKLVWDVVAGIHVGNSGGAFVTDQLGKLIAHPDLSKVLRGTDDDAARSLRRLRDEIEEAGGRSIMTVNSDKEPVVANMAEVPGADWTVFVEQPEVEAFAPIYAALWRTGGLLLAAAVAAAALACWLAGRMTVPIRVLEEGTEKIGAGQFEHRINIATGDELERLAARWRRASPLYANGRSVSPG